MEKIKNNKSIVYLGDNSNTFNQLVYASQLYGTFFAVYASIETDAGSHKDEREIKDITCHIINYKGVLNIGLEDVIYNSGTGQIDLHLKALGNISKEIKCKKLTKFRKSKSDTLVFRRRLEKLPEGINHGVFEIEGYYRDGHFTKPRPDYDDLTTENSKTKTAPLAPGARCMMSELEVLI